MRFNLVPFAVTVQYRGRDVAAVGLPLAWIFADLMRWLESGVPNL
jgi:hypothetical protein